MPKKLTLDQIISKKPLNSRLTPIAFAESTIYPYGKPRRNILANCTCGNKHILDVAYFINGRILSCGCYNVEKGQATRLSVGEINLRKHIRSMLTVISYNRDIVMPSGQIKKEYLCLCKCGKETHTTSDRIISGNTISCGCWGEWVRIRLGIIKQNFFPKVTELQQTYYNMVSRCYRPYHMSYKYYGGAGVTVCDEWLNSYQKFLDWSLANGWQKGLQLDKDIKSIGEKIYSPDTCSWVTPTVNSRHTSRNVKYNLDGRFLTIKEISELTGKKQHSILYIMNKHNCGIGLALIIANNLNTNDNGKVSRLVIGSGLERSCPQRQ